jgi:hypothetical protein
MLRTWRKAALTGAGAGAGDTVPDEASLCTQKN